MDSCKSKLGNQKYDNLNYLWDGYRMQKIDFFKFVNF